MHVQLKQLFLHIGVGQRGQHLFVQPGNHLLGRFGGRGQGVPRGHIKVRHATLHHGGHIGHLGRALVTQNGQRAHRLGVHLAHHGPQNFDGHIHLTAAQCRGERRRAVEGHDQKVQPGARLEQLGRQMLGAADVDGAHIELAGVGLGVGQQFSQVLERRARRGQHRQIEIAQGGHRSKVALGVKRQALEQARTHRRAIGHEQQGVAIGLRLGHRLARAHTTGAGLVVDDDGLPQRLRELLRHGARRQVGHTAGAEGHHDADGLAGEGIGHSGQGQRQGGQGNSSQCAAAGQTVHRKLPWNKKSR